MSDTDQAIEQEARSMGWVPEAEFRGDKSRWVDATTFVERGHTVLPIVKKRNEQLESQVHQLTAETRRLQQLFAASQESIQALNEFHEKNTKERVERAKADLLQQIKAAKQEGDIDLEVQLTDELSEVNAEIKALTTKKPDNKQQQQQQQEGDIQVDPALAEWAGRNTWFGKDVRKTNLAQAIANEIRANPELDSVIGTEFYKMIDAEMERRTNGGSGGVDKVMGSRNSGGSGSGGSGSGKNGYSDLPAEAKAICDADAKRFVGEGRMYKTVDDYRKFYARQYFGE